MPEVSLQVMAVDQSAALGEFARTAKAAARAASLYPPTHPSIQASLQRIVAASARMTANGGVTLTVQPDVLAIDDQIPARPDPAVRDLAALLHDRLVGTLQIEPAATGDDWLALLLLLAKSPEELFAQGGIASAWTATGRSRFGIREIDYAEVLRERSGAGDAGWDQIVRFCLQGDEGGRIDDSSLAALVDDPSQFQALLDTLETAAHSASIGARAGAILKLLETLSGAARSRGQDAAAALMRTAADSLARLGPEVLLALLSRGRQGSAEERQVAHDIVANMSDGAIASLVAGSVVAERGATERLAQAFETLVPEQDRKEQLIGEAHDAVAATPLGQQDGFEELWQNAASMLMSYSDSNYVSADYGRELSEARTQAMEIERVSDDPPERVQTWLSTVSDKAVADLDVALISDLLRLEEDADAWRDLAGIAIREIERRTVLGDAARIEPLLDAIARERNEGGRPALRATASAVLEGLAAGPLVRHVVLQLRKTDDAHVEPLNRLCHAIGPALVRPLAEALATEDNPRAIRRLRELLLGFGAAGRQSVEQLKNSSNPAVRRTAIDLLRVFGGREALPELASMLDDDDPQVQRDSIRAIVQIATPEAYAILERALGGSATSRELIVQQLIALRDTKTLPLLCYVLRHTTARGKLVQMHVDVMDALGGLGAHADSIGALKDALYRGDWWAPGRTAVLRQKAAAALRRIGSEEALAILMEAMTHGGRGIRNAVRPHIGASVRRERVSS